MSEEKKQVRTGVDVDIELIDRRGDRESMRVVIVRGETADLDSGVLASAAPLAKAILGKRVGVEVPYRRGDIVAVRIVSVGDTADVAADEAVARRQQTVEKAVRSAERTSAEMFASSFTSKWGGYDADNLSDWEETKEEDDGQTQT